MNRTNSNMNVLLAEDDEDDQEFIRQAFDELNLDHSLQIVNNGQEAIEHLQRLPDQHLPCLIILDMNMPVLDGLQTLKILNGYEKYSAIPKVVFTTSDSHDYKKKSLENGATDYIVKPSNINKFVQSIQEMVNFCR